MFRLLSIISIIPIILTGCSSTPESLEVKEGVQLVNYKQASAQPEQQRGKLALWGGVIASINNQAESTVLQITQFRLTARGEPVVEDNSEGRFLVYVEGFLDPMIYQVGRRFSVIGQLGGIEPGDVGDYTYEFPVLHADGFHLWPEQNTTVTQVDVWPRHGHLSWGIWPFHSYYGPTPYRTRIITRHADRRSSNVVNSFMNNDSTKPMKQTKPAKKQKKQFSPVPERDYRPSKKVEP